jgi:hypothetical protein
MGTTAVSRHTDCFSVQQIPELLYVFGADPGDKWLHN